MKCKIEHILKDPVWVCTKCKRTIEDGMDIIGVVTGHMSACIPVIHRYEFKHKKCPKKKKGDNHVKANS